YWKLPASNSSMGMAAALGCACVRRINTENANNITCHYDPLGYSRVVGPSPELGTSAMPLIRTQPPPGLDQFTCARNWAYDLASTRRIRLGQGRSYSGSCW